MEIITFCSFKGGTAKTSAAMHLGYVLAKKYKKKVLLIDFDPQANLSIGLGLGPDQEKTMALVLKGQKKVNQVITNTNYKNLDIVCSNAYLDGIEKTPELGIDPYAHERLRRALKNLDYDFCFIDTPPSLGWLTQSAFFASNSSMICCIPEAYSVIALRRLKEFHESINQYHPITVEGVILSFWDERGAVNKPFLKAIEEAFSKKIYSAKIRRDIAVSRAVLLGEPVIEFSPKSRASLDYLQLGKEFIKRKKDRALLKKLVGKNKKGIANGKAI